jgi:hypothetical protein
MPRGNKGEKGKGSGIRCVAANCGNTNADGVIIDCHQYFLFASFAMG